MEWEKLGRWVGGFLIGTAGVKMLGSHDARKVYAWGTAFYLRGRDYVLDCANAVKEVADDAYAEALAINERYAEEDAQVIEDRAKKTAAKKKEAKA